MFRTKRSTNESPILPESVVILRECEGAIPANQFATHNEDRSVRIDITPFIEKSSGVFSGVKEYKPFPKNIEVDYVAYTWC